MDAMKILLMTKGAKYDELSKLSLIYHPFLLKFLLAPVVDSVKNFLLIFRHISENLAEAKPT